MAFLRYGVRTTCLVVYLSLAGAARGDGPLDNIPAVVRPIPKLGIEVDAASRAELEDGLSKLAKAIDALCAADDPRVAELLPDVLVLQRAVRTNLDHQEFFTPKDIRAAKELLREGQRRAAALATGRAPWTEATGLIVRGYLSKIDHTAQPYGLVVPEGYRRGSPTRLDVWFHGRGETLSETNFLAQRMNDPGQFTPAQAIVLHPYGRYSNAFKFAGEVDVLEAIEHVRRHYTIDEDRISVRGFSMGGAATWHFAAHHASRWFAANPGAGFAETEEFLRVFQNERVEPTWYERKLYHWYDATDWAMNLRQCPTVAYSGEIDPQKQAADIMQTALANVGIDLAHLIGPGTKHAYHSDAKQEVERRLDDLARVGRQALPRTIHFVTYTLRYNRMNWLSVDGLREHWEKGAVDAHIIDDRKVSLTTNNITALTLSIPSGLAPFDPRSHVMVEVDGQSLEGPRPLSDRSWTIALHRDGDHWRTGPLESTGPRKVHGLQGPIDDAFMDSFIFVRPTGKSAHEAIGRWTDAEMDHAISHWRRQFRGDARVKDDRDITAADIADANLVLWGDATSNSILARIASQLPIMTTGQQIVVGEQTFDAGHHTVACAFPNPLNPCRYVVLNSGFTYREYAYLNNARQVPKLPDWAVIDVRVPADSLWPGKVVSAGFFDENWRLNPQSP